MPKRGFELGRDFHGRCSFREGLAMAAPHGAGMLPLYVGDLPGRRLQAVFPLYPCVDFLKYQLFLERDFSSGYTEKSVIPKREENTREIKGRERKNSV